MNATATVPATGAPHGRVTPERTHDLTGTLALLRFVLRRDRVRLPVWTMSIAAFFLYAAGAIGTIYPTAQDRQVRAQLVSSPAAIMMTGPGYGMDNYTLGAIMANEIALYAMIAAAIMSIQLIVRHTRAEEETGSAELVRAAVVGRHAPETAAFLAAVLANVTVAVLVGAALAASGLAVVDSFALGAAAGVTGVVFAAVAVVTCQVTAHARSASGGALAVLGVAFLLRAVGDVRTHGSWMSWLSPIGWAQQIRAFVDLRWWPLGLSLLLVVTLLVLGALLAARRDFGAGLVPPRAGRADAVPSLASPFALAWRQQRGSLWAWGVGVGVMSLAMGTFVNSVGDALTELDNPAVADILAGANPTEADLVNGFIGYVSVFLALAIAASSLSSALRARAEEGSGRLEPVLATPTSRSRWLGAQLAVTVVGTVVLLVVSGTALGLGAFAAGQSDPGIGVYVLASVIYLPAVLLIVGLAWACYGWRPGLASLVWAVYAYAAVVGMFGALLQLPDWAGDLTPFSHLPQVPVDAFDVAPVVVELLLAGALVALGFAGFRRRDIGR